VLPKDTDAHKGSLGKALFISGSSKYFGAPFFNAFSFIKGGGGLSYLATTERVGNVVLSNAKEVVLLPQIESENHTISRKTLKIYLNFQIVLI